MKLFLITNEFFRSATERSFRATVIAPTEIVARWLFGLRCSGELDATEVADTFTFDLGKLPNASEGVLAVEYNNASSIFSKSEFADRKRRADTFYEAKVNRKDIDKLFGPVDGKVTWFAPYGGGDVLLRRTFYEPTHPDDTLSNEFGCLQFFRIGWGVDNWEYKAGGETFTTDYCDMTNASLLEIRAEILRSTALRQDYKIANILIQQLWSYISETKEDESEPADFSFFAGQKLYWKRKQATDWAMGIPQFISVVPTIHEVNTQPICKTNCITLLDPKDQ